MKQGVFWVIPKINDFEILYRFNDTSGHNEIWEEVISRRTELKKYDYEYFPRGRVWIKNNIATIFLNPKLNNPAILHNIKEIFCLTDYNVITDNSI